MKKKILYIEDNKTLKMVVKGLLESENFQVFEAGDGVTGIEMAKEIRPDLILMDMNIPGMDGYEATTKIKSIHNLSKIPIIALTGETDIGDR